ncbi:MAG: ADP-ribosylation factor-like protein [Promethearchaeati archaeon SRVP18_Atabeyarchaeia-1]
MPIIKILIMGLPASGKTTFVKHVFEGKELNDLKDYIPTYGVNIALYNYKGSEDIKISTFDCGGQTSFIDTYLTDQWVPRLFAEVSALFFVVDSSSKKTLKDANKLFHKYLENVYKYSEDVVIHVLASKWDKHTITRDELKEAFSDLDVRPISVVDGSARQVTQAIMDRLISERKTKK